MPTIFVNPIKALDVTYSRIWEEDPLEGLIDSMDD